MVHLTSVPNDSATKASLAEGLEKFNLKGSPDEDDANTSVYGSRFANECLPMHEVQWEELPGVSILG